MFLCSYYPQRRDIAAAANIIHYHGSKGLSRKRERSKTRYCTSAQVFYCQNFPLLFTAVKTILQRFGLVVDVQTISERRRFFNSRRTF